MFTIAFVEIFCIDEYVKPDKEPLSSEQQEIADRYYELMLREYPSFKAIPREMLSEAVYQGVDGYMSVKYTFCLGGIPTDCHADFSKGPDDPEGRWYKSENIFMKYYSTGLTEKQMTEMRAEIEKQILQLVDEYKLKREGMEEETVLYWRIEKAECISPVNISRLLSRKRSDGSRAAIMHIFSDTRLLNEFGRMQRTKDSKQSREISAEAVYNSGTAKQRSETAWNGWLL